MNRDIPCATETDKLVIQDVEVFLEFCKHV